MIRNVFHPDEDPEYWREAVRDFPNKVPRFQDKDGARAFMKMYCQYPSNPSEPELYHSITTFTDWSQIEHYLLPKMKEYDRKWAPVNIPNPDILAQNRYLARQQASQAEGDHSGSDDIHPVMAYLTSRLDLPIHQRMSPEISGLNTLRYLFDHMRCGIYVMIRDNQVVLFAPFVNKDYTNNWADTLQVDSPDGGIETYYSAKRQHCREENIIEKQFWWANGNIICNEHVKPNAVGRESITQWWGDHFLFQLKDMLAETCRRRQVPDCEFFLNKRDYPQLKFNADQWQRPVEPYGFIFDRDDRLPEEDVPLSRHLYKSYLPILSFYTSRRFADIPFPTSEDWEAATGEIFVPTLDAATVDEAAIRDNFTSANLQKFERPWDEKIPVAFFRGSASGGGVTAETNQRLHLAQLSYDWEQEHKQQEAKADAESEAATGSPTPYYPHLDAKITGWNKRDKKIASCKMTFIKESDFKFAGGKVNYVPIYEQSMYKYVIYAEGHCAACRYAFMMQLGSVILRVESRCVADQLWYFPLLKPYEDHVPVKADLSDLREQIEWCRANDERCREIAANAKELYAKYISLDGILDYMQAICVETARRMVIRPAWLDTGPAPPSGPRPEFGVLTGYGQARCCVPKLGEYCTTCQLLKEREDLVEQRRVESQAAEQTENERRKRARNEKRMRGLEESRLLRLLNRNSGGNSSNSGDSYFGSTN